MLFDVDYHTTNSFSKDCFLDQQKQKFLNCCDVFDSFFIANSNIFWICFTSLNELKGLIFTKNKMRKMYPPISFSSSCLHQMTVTIQEDRGKKRCRRRPDSFWLAWKMWGYWSVLGRRAWYKKCDLIFSVTLNVINVKLCLMILLTELYLFCLPVTLTIFQGHSSVKQF